jgi:hypothetical protein
MGAFVVDPHKVKRAEELRAQKLAIRAKKEAKRRAKLAAQ